MEHIKVERFSALEISWKGKSWLKREKRDYEEKEKVKQRKQE